MTLPIRSYTGIRDIAREAYSEGRTLDSSESCIVRDLDLYDAEEGQHRRRPSLKGLTQSGLTYNVRVGERR